MYRRILGCDAEDKTAIIPQARKVSGRLAGRAFCDDAHLCFPLAKAVTRQRT